MGRKRERASEKTWMFEDRLFFTVFTTMLIVVVGVFIAFFAIVVPMIKSDFDMMATQEVVCSQYADIPIQDVPAKCVSYFSE